jgi:hypothetical protein
VCVVTVQRGLGIEQFKLSLMVSPKMQQLLQCAATEHTTIMNTGKGPSEPSKTTITIKVLQVYIYYEHWYHFQNNTKHIIGLCSTLHVL